MDDIFLIKLIISFIVGALWVLITTLIADKLGSKLGGLVASLPSTLLFSLFFISWTQDTTKAVEATSAIPFVAIGSLIFLICFIKTIKYGLFLSLIISIIIWFFFAFMAIFVKDLNYLVSLVSFLTAYIFAVLLLKYKIKFENIKSKANKYTFKQILLRGVLCGSLVTISVFLGKILGPIVGGIFGMFPAMFISTLIITHLTHGIDFSTATAKSAMVGLISIVIFSIIVRFIYIPLGSIFGTILGMFVSIIITYLSLKLIINKYLKS